MEACLQNSKAMSSKAPPKPRSGCKKATDKDFALISTAPLI